MQNGGCLAGSTQKYRFEFELHIVINLGSDTFGNPIFQNILIKRWSEAKSFTIFENHVYSH